MILVVHGRKVGGVLSSDGTFDPDMRESLATAARRYGVVVHLPSVSALKDNGIDPGVAKAVSVDSLSKLATSADSALPLAGTLQWSDAAHGWIATWSLDAGGRHFKWKVAGVNYDEAFRVAVRGAGRALSGNGKPLGGREPDRRRRVTTAVICRGFGMPFKNAEERSFRQGCRTHRHRRAGHSKEHRPQGSFQKPKKTNGAMQAGARRYPEPPLPEQHHRQARPGGRSRPRADVRRAAITRARTSSRARSR